MPWLLRIAIAYVTLMIAGIALIQGLAHTIRYPTFQVSSGDRRYVLVGYRELPLPFFLGGHGREPGEVQVLDNRGHVLDGMHLDYVSSASSVDWERFRVYFDYMQDGRVFRTSLDLAQ